MNRNIYHQIVGCLYEKGFVQEAKILAQEDAFEKKIKNRKFKHPDTGNMVKFGSLPTEEQKKIRERETVKQPEEPKKEEPKKESKIGKPKKGRKTKKDVQREYDAIEETEKNAIKEIDKRYKEMYNKADKKDRKKILEDREKHKEVTLKELRKGKRKLEKILEKGKKKKDNDMFDEDELEDYDFSVFKNMSFEDLKEKDLWDWLKWLGEESGVI